MSSSEEPRAADGLPEPGDVLGDKYRVERVVGVGGMGVVVAAVHIQLEERVALKVMKPEAMNPDTVARFLREAKSAAKIKSEHVARVHDVGVLPNGAPFMVMELLEGEDLSERIKEHGALPIAEAVDYVLQACEAVAEAHALGIVHRDLKPANLFLARRAGGRRVVKVVDFGISKQITEGVGIVDGSKTRTSAWLGSPLYMSPEQMRSAKDVDARADLWSLGLILYELTTAHVPFDAASLVELCGRVLHDAPTPIEEWLPDAPPELVNIMARALQKDRELRYQTAADFAEDLAALSVVRPPATGVSDASGRVDRIVSILGAPPRQLSSRPPPLEDAAPVPLLRQSKAITSAAAETASTGLEADRRPSRASRKAAWPAWLTAALLLVAVFGTGAFFWRRTHPDVTLRTTSEVAPAATVAVTAPPSSPIAQAAPTSAATAEPAPTVSPAVSTIASAAPTVVAAASATAGKGAAGGPAKGAAKKAGASPAPSAAPVVTASPAVAAPEPTSGGNRIVTCFEVQADGSRKPVPCP